MTAWRPGDRRPDRASMLRVNQAGEYGATRIYAGQLAVLRRNSPASKLIARMDGQERRHLERFNALMAQRRVRPTVLQPVWDVAGFALGAAIPNSRPTSRNFAPKRSSTETVRERLAPSVLSAIHC
jgi:ubiquinone biosynthesis monooxygenase Coq7